MPYYVKDLLKRSEGGGTNVEFDEIPMENSNNAVKSKGIKKAIDGILYVAKHPDEVTEENVRGSKVFIEIGDSVTLENAENKTY